MEKIEPFKQNNVGFMEYIDKSNSCENEKDLLFAYHYIKHLEDKIIEQEKLAHVHDFTQKHGIKMYKIIDFITSTAKDKVLNLSIDKYMDLLISEEILKVKPFTDFSKVIKENLIELLNILIDYDFDVKEVDIAK